MSRVSINDAFAAARGLFETSGDNEDYNQGVIEMLQQMFNLTEVDVKDRINQRDVGVMPASWIVASRHRPINPRPHGSFDLGIVGGVIDFLPEGQLKWRCLEKARELMEEHGPKPANPSHQTPGGYIISDYNAPRQYRYPNPRFVADDGDVLALAKEIYDWVSGESSRAVESSKTTTDGELREFFTKLLIGKYPGMPREQLSGEVSDLIEYIRLGRPRQVRVTRWAEQGVASGDDTEVWEFIVKFQVHAADKDHAHRVLMTGLRDAELTTSSVPGILHWSYGTAKARKIE